MLLFAAKSTHESAAGYITSVPGRTVVTRATLASAGINVVLSVCLYVCLSQVGVLLKRLCVSRKQRHAIAMSTRERLQNDRATPEMNC